MPVNLQVLLRNLERRTRGVNAGDPGADPSQMQGKTTLISANIQRLAVGIA